MPTGREARRVRGFDIGSLQDIFSKNVLKPYQEFGGKTKRTPSFKQLRGKR
jgi:hypothetical protein